MDPKHKPRIYQEPCHFHAQTSADGSQGQRRSEKVLTCVTSPLKMYELGGQGFFRHYISVRLPYVVSLVSYLYFILRH